MIISKRRRYIITSVLLSLGFIGVQFLTDQNRFWAIGALSLTTLLFFAWSLWEGVGVNMTLLTLVLPTVFTLGVGTFWFLLPANIYTLIPVVIFYGIGIYILCLTMNIYTVAAIRTIALLRAAMGVGFVLTLITSFLVFDALLSLRSPIFVLIPLVFTISLPLYFQGFWAMPLEKEFSKDLLMLAIVASLVTAEIAAVLYFWPVTVVVGSLFLTVTFYMLLGLGQAHLDERLFPATVKEYLTVGTLVFIAMFFATHWG
ncbi:MAG TPA: hypothetical protein VL401_02705 [Alphaproteobacteria bacterium]|jgi:hypothetical protein|nr:hypothetical protein [Alphaproteobacteria bacterium]